LVVLKKILDVLERNHQIERKFLELLLSPQLDSLDLSTWKQDFSMEPEVGNVLHLASIKCMVMPTLKQFIYLSICDFFTYMACILCFPESEKIAASWSKCWALHDFFSSKI
jgi:hypothetical protein